jgi:hypothetical protein
MIRRTDPVIFALEAKTFTDEDMAAADHYVLSNGHDFVWVKDAGTLAAGKCWIELVPSSPAHARALSIVFEGETTGTNAVSSSADKMDGEWYDLSGYPTHTGRIVFDDYTAWRNIFAYPSL